MPLEVDSLLNDRYRIQGQLGKGGMGAVYLAFDETLEIRVAVKENLNLNPESERQFRREATLLAGLRHPNLPRVTDHFILNDRQYLVMDYIEGMDLHARAAQQPPSLAEVLQWADALCDALAYLHSRKPPVIHRDIKPANIKLQPNGNVVLVDFGIAKIFEQAQTTTGARGLTPGFSPPEQYGGQRTDARSDQYSLAATVYSLLTGRKPADSVQRMLRKEMLKPIRELNPAVPEHVEAALARALALDKDERFPDIRVFRAALRGELAMETIRAPQETLLPPAAPRPHSRRWLRWLFGFLSVTGLAAAAFIGARFMGYGAPPSTTFPTNTAIAVAPPFTSTPRPEPILPTEDINPTDTPEMPTKTPTPSIPVIGGGGRIIFSSDREDGSTLQIWSMNADGSDPRQITFGPGDKTQPRWSPDGERILYVSPGGRDAYGNNLGLDIFVFNVDRSSEPKNLTASPGDDFDPAWSPDGTKIAFTSTRVNDLRQVFLMDVTCAPAPDTCEPNGKPRNLSAGYAVEFAPAWAPDGMNLAVAASINGAGGRLYLRSIYGGEPTRFDRRDRIIGADSVDWSPDGQFLVFSWVVQHNKQEIYIASVENPALDPVALTNSLGNKQPVFSRDGQVIVFTSTRDQNPEIYTMTTNGSGQKNISQNPGRDLDPDWQPIPPE